MKQLVTTNHANIYVKKLCQHVCEAAEDADSSEYVLEYLCSTQLTTWFDVGRCQKLIEQNLSLYYLIHIIVLMY